MIEKKILRNWAVKIFNFPTGFAATAFLYTLKNLRDDKIRNSLLSLEEINVSEGGNISIAQSWRWHLDLTILKRETNSSGTQDQPMFSTGVLQLHVWTGGNSLPVQHLPGGRLGEPDGGGDCERNQVSPHHNQLLPCLPRPGRPHHPSLLCTSGWGEITRFLLQNESKRPAGVNFVFLAE